ncbi:helix-turn-helix domain-containing protein [Actinomadura sp. 9N407]|uniref:helix-turn-helix domain-containing protein n=1 Tax=Actinomadura sp. 9N407 TaxID=3375154 RepID=UPI00378C5CA5
MQQFLLACDRIRTTGQAGRAQGRAWRERWKSRGGDRHGEHEDRSPPYPAGMAGSEDFEAMLSRLLAHRRLDAGELATVAGVPESELVAVLGGAEPSPSMLRGLAPALGLHTSDLFLIAGHQVPDDLAPMGPAEPGVSSLVWHLVSIPQAGPQVLELVRSLPRQAHPEQAPPQAYDEWFVPGFGATLLRLFGNRNMRDFDAVGALWLLAGFGPWARTTLRMVGSRQKETSADLVAACATVLGIPPGDLAALAGVDVLDQPPNAAPEAVKLIWDARNFTAEQMQYLDEQSHVIRHEHDDVVPPHMVCHCPLFRRERMS